MIHLLVAVILGAYGAASILFLLDVSFSRPRRQLFAERLLFTGWIAHSGLILVSMLDGSVSIGNFSPGRGDYYLWIAWALPLVYRFAGIQLRCSIVGAFLAPLALLFFVSSSYLVHYQEQTPVQVGILFRLLHLFPAFVSEVSLIFAFIVSCVFLIQERRLKNKKTVALLLRGPSLDRLEQVNRRFVLTGFVAMTFAILSGSAWSMWYGHGLLQDDLFQWLGIIVWFLLALIHNLRSNRGASPRALARLTVGATALLFIALGLFVGLGEGMGHANFYP